MSNQTYEIKIIGLENTMIMHAEYLNVEGSMRKPFTNARFLKKLHREWRREHPDSDVRMKRIK